MNRKETHLMKTYSSKKSVTHYLTRLSKYLVVGGIAIVLAVPQVEAAPDRHRAANRRVHDSHPGKRSGYYRGHHPAPVVVHRGWSRPGFYGAYPPIGYVNYRYIHSLPRGYRIVYRGGHRYYYANGSYYWPAFYNNGGIFLSVSF
jgi:hypothetical protein